MSTLQLTDLWFKIWHFTHLWDALLGFCNPPLPFSVINMKHIKNLKKTRSKWGICKNLKLWLENFNRTQKSLKHELYHKISHLGNNKKVKEVTSLSLSNSLKVFLSLPPIFYDPESIPTTDLQPTSIIKI